MRKFVIERVQKKLVFWKGRLLFMGSKLVLIKVCLFNLFIYCIFLFKIIKGVIDEIEGLMRKFLWSNGVEKKLMCLLSWDLMGLFKKLGWFGMDILRLQNIVFLFKWILRFLEEDNVLQKGVVKGKYKMEVIFNFSELKVL